MSGNIFVEIRNQTKIGAVKAYADIRISFPDGSLDIHGFPVVVQDGKPPWVAFPKKPGTTHGRFFPIVEADGKLREQIIDAILDAFRNRQR
jgi:DNA-binding cell septation regulator SpoVG